MQASEDVDMMRGRHHISFGGEWLHYQFNYANIYQSNGSLAFDGYATGNALLDFMLGLPRPCSKALKTFTGEGRTTLGPMSRTTFG